MKVLGIDSSLNGTGLCLLDDFAVGSKPSLIETIRHEESVLGMHRLIANVTRIVAVVDEYKPDLIVMEDYAMGTTSTNNLTRLAELGGVIKIYCHARGYEMGYGTGRNEDERAAARLVTHKSPKLFVHQTVGTMKKFCLGSGHMEKDSRYLLNVHERMKRSFDDDNQADAYMHAWMAGIVLDVLRGNLPLDNLPAYQVDAIMGSHVKKLPKGMSKGKMLKLPNAEKLKLLDL